MNKKDIMSYDLNELTEELERAGEKKFRAKQVYKWLHVKGAASFDAMTDLSKELRDSLNESFIIMNLKTADVKTSTSDGTKKFLFALDDGNVIESVYMKYRDWNSVCISSQVGCRMGCKFCASTIDGCVRSLSASEMLGEVYAIGRETGSRISNVVVMGSGEPLDNFDNLLKFIKMISDENGLNVSQRNITVSTCGIVPGIYKLAEEHLQINLALSLHAATDDKRKKIMPIAMKYPLGSVIKACSDYFDATGRRLTFEYALIEGINDKQEDIDEIVRLIGKLNCYVNIIPVNPVTERDFKRPDRQAALRFKNKLEKMGINVSIRRELGSDIDGACGQLRRKYVSGDSNEKEKEVKC